MNIKKNCCGLGCSLGIAFMKFLFDVLNIFLKFQQYLPRLEGKEDEKNRDEENSSNCEQFHWTNHCFPHIVLWGD
ncbi:MAG: hypothetical protein Q4A31_12405 [Corynebacterium sp.]|uniref:hypothetical protein n=1 Tax=Corynebacterium sp. TaxID=1720 RepID=UPI0026DBFA53|nr:hypothetical protein [Corynebacterium sp.]MDO4762713.1 hypothetical protein [Corynebacterium sp.]